MKIHNLLIFVLALGIIGSTANANFQGFHRNGNNNYGPNNQGPFNQGPNFGGPNFGENNNQGPGNDGHRRFGMIWRLLCGGGEREWNFQNEGQERKFERLIRKFKRICGNGRDVEIYCEWIRKNCENRPPNGPRPPSNAVPEPSTYGLIGASALLGLIGFRRFKRKSE